MITINLYQPKAVNISIPFPSNWNDLTLYELNLVAKSILSNFNSAAEANAALFLSLLKIRCGKKVKHIQKRLDAEDAVINGLPAIDFIYKENNLTKQPYPTLNPKPLNFLNLKPFHGPLDDFNSITCGEFEDAEFFFNKFRQDPSANHLAHLAAILYRPKDVKYICYDSKTASHIHYDAEKTVVYFKKLKPWVLYSIFLWYAGCREQLPKIFPNCFGPSKLETEENREPDFLIFTKCIHAGAGPKNGSRNEIRCTLLKEFFLEIELQNLENIELQNQIDYAK